MLRVFSAAPFRAAASALDFPVPLLPALVCLAVCSLYLLAQSRPQFAQPTRDLTPPAAFLPASDSAFVGSFVVFPSPLFTPVFGPAAPAGPAALSGRVTYEGTPKKYKPIDMSAEPKCAKVYDAPPLPEVSITGPENSLQNVIVYVSSGTPDENFTGGAVHLVQRGCRYTPHVVTAQTGQEVWVQNDDTVTHSVHPMAHANAEWNRSQPPGTPPVVIRYSQPEFIRVKCELHPWMRGVLAVFKNSHHTVTDSTGAFTLPGLAPGKYTITAWHELYGEQSKEITIVPGQTAGLNFVFKVTPY